MNGDGSGKQQLTDAPNYSENPNWSPDGQWIVFDSDRAEKGDLDDLQDARPTAPTSRSSPSSPSLDALPAFSPDGKKLVFISDRALKDSRKLYVMPAGGGAARRVIGTPGYTYQMVPDWQPLRQRDTCTIRGTIHADVLDGHGRRRRHLRPRRQRQDRRGRRQRQDARWPRQRPADRRAWSRPPRRRRRQGRGGCRQERPPVEHREAAQALIRGQGVAATPPPISLAGRR